MVGAILLDQLTKKFNFKFYCVLCLMTFDTAFHGRENNYIRNHSIDCSSVFHWNAKQVYLSVVMSYMTESYVRASLLDPLFEYNLMNRLVLLFGSIFY